LSQRKVARRSGVPQKCVFGVSSKLEKSLTLFNAAGQGRKKATTPADDRKLLRIMKKDLTKSREMLAHEWTLSNRKRLCASTARRRLITMGHKSYTAKRKPLKTPAQIKKRLKFAKEHQYWLSEWNNIIWSDEAHFEVLNRKNGGGGSVSVWGCIAGGARGPLVIYNDRFNGPVYINTIKEALPMFIHNTFDAGDQNWTYMQDNAPCHTSKYTMNWM
ncbi:unnamed protein product, partial [Rotaria socialis]